MADIIYLYFVLSLNLHALCLGCGWWPQDIAHLLHADSTSFKSIRNLLMHVLKGMLPPDVVIASTALGESWMGVIIYGRFAAVVVDAYFQRIERT